ncbi:MAG: carboxyl-terminal processing protease [Alphaproteobacteria bacterium]|jgi:carboxyl-terminal processing protease
MKKHAFVAAFLGCTLVTSAVPAQDKDRETYRQLELFGTVFEQVRSNYVEEPKIDDMMESAINGMLTSLDPHSSYVNEKAFRANQIQFRGEFGGLGIEVTMEDGLVKVVSPIDDTPASRAGLMSGDMVSHIDGQAVRGLTLQQAVYKMRGPVGADIKLTIRRSGKPPFDVTLTRANIKIASVKSRIEDKDIAYVRITSFNEQTTSGLEKAVKTLNEKSKGKLVGMVLDLRNNPGGLLKEAISVSDAFLDKGEIVSTRGRNKDDGQRWNAKKGDITNGMPVIVLINGGSASASEIVAGALQDHRRGIILGTQSFGKGSVQTIIPLPGHGALRLTTQRYYTPSGESIQAKGIKPDITVEQLRLTELSDEDERREKDLRGALVNPGNANPANDKGKSKETAPKGEDKDATKDADDQRVKDYQLTRAIGVLRGIALYRRTAN